jgi:uncharacterized membrane protein YGL010W
MRPLVARRLVAVVDVVAALVLDGMFLMLFLAFVLGVLLSTRRQLEEVIARENVLDSSAS